MNKFLPSLALAVAFAFVLPANAALLFTEDFDVDSTANWTVNSSAALSNPNQQALFFFDYSTAGIPPAPGSTTTRGLKMYANHSAGAASGLSVSPNGQSFSGDYVLKFHAWLNYNGAASPGNGLGIGGDVTLGGGNGSTQVGSWGLLTAGNTPQWSTGAAGGTIDSIFFAATGDGGAAQDYRVHPKTAVMAVPSTGYYAAGNVTTPIDVRTDNHDYYNGMGGKNAPAAQLGSFPQQHGTTRDGALGMAWRQVQVIKVGNFVQWTVDDRLFATVDISTLGAFGGTNFFLGHADINGTPSTDPNDVALLFTLIDNVVVYEAIPEPGAWMFGLVAAVVSGAGAIRRRRDAA